MDSEPSAQQTERAANQAHSESSEQRTVYSANRRSSGSKGQQTASQTANTAELLGNQGRNANEQRTERKANGTDSETNERKADR